MPIASEVAKRQALAIALILEQSERLTGEPIPLTLESRYGDGVLRAIQLEEIAAWLATLPVGYALMTRAELMAQVEMVGLEVVGTGTRGYVTREDLINALEEHNAS